MANRTFYGMELPSQEEFYDVEVQNRNMQVIDENLYAIDPRHADEKNTINNLDTITVNDSISGGILKKVTWDNIKTILAKTFASLSHTHTKSQITDFPTTMTPSAHKNSHKTGGSDAISPSDIGAVKKNGDTMTGTLVAPALVLNDYSAALEVGQFIDMHLKDSTSDFDGRLHLASDGSLLYSKDVGTNHHIIHTGNTAAQMISRIQVGSYMGTGINGSSTPMSLSFAFIPKAVIVVADSFDKSRAGNIFVKGQTKASFIGIGETSAADRTTVIWAENTVSWYASSAAGQLNEASTNYCYVAIG